MSAAADSKTPRSYGEFMTMFAKTVAERTKPGQRQDVEEQDYTFHAYSRTEGVCGIIISDQAYPGLVAHQLLSKVLDEFLSSNPRSSWINAGPESIAFPQLKEYLTKYQDPHQADSILKIQKELDETKIVLHKTIESVLERGEKIDTLVAKSDGLSAQSKMFYSTFRAPPYAGARQLRVKSAGRMLTWAHCSSSKEAEFVLRCHVERQVQVLPETDLWIPDVEIDSARLTGLWTGLAVQTARGRFMVLG